MHYGWKSAILIVAVVMVIQWFWMVQTTRAIILMGGVVAEEPSDTPTKSELTLRTAIAELRVEVRLFSKNMEVLNENVRRLNETISRGKM